MDALNLYSGVGGNRKLWPEHVNVVAVEDNPLIAKAYKELFPKDAIIIADAHRFLLTEFENYDFIWSSPPCPSHSRARKWAHGGGKTKAVYPDMRLYEEILFLQHYAGQIPWVVENVIPYYDMLVPGKTMGRHAFWSNFYIPAFKFKDNDIHSGKESDWIEATGFDLSKYEFGQRKDQIYRNIVLPELGEHIFNAAFNKQKPTEQLNLWTQLKK